MKTLPIDLMTLTQHIHTQYEKVLNNKSFLNRMCYCRQQIFEQFTITVEKLIIKLGSRTLKFAEDHDMSYGADFTHLRMWFANEVYQVLYKNEEVSNKMVLTFKLIQEYQDEKFFDLIQDKYKHILVHIAAGDNATAETEFNVLFEEIRAWYELFLYMILSTQFNCQSLTDAFLVDHNVPSDFGAGVDNITNWCIHHNDCATCEVHEGVLQCGESINIIMVNDFIDDMTWLEKLTCIVNNYHVAPTHITLNLDYRMYDQLVQCKLSHVHYDKILEANRTFVDLHIKNHEGINFNGYYDKVKHLLD